MSDLLLTCLLDCYCFHLSPEWVLDNSCGQRTLLDLCRVPSSHYRTVNLLVTLKEQPACSPVADLLLLSCCVSEPRDLMSDVVSYGLVPLIYISLRIRRKVCNTWRQTVKSAANTCADCLFLVDPKLARATPYHQKSKILQPPPWVHSSERSERAQGGVEGRSPRRKL